MLFRSGQVSIIDLLEKLQTSGFPVVIPRLSLLFYVSRDKTDPDVCSPTLVCRSGGDDLLKTVLKVDFQGSDVARVVVSLDNLSIPGPGLFAANLRLGDRDWGQLELEVSLAAADPNPHLVKSGKFSYRVT